MSPDTSDGDLSVRSAEEQDVEVVASIWQRGWSDGHAGHVPAALESARRSGCWADEAARRVDTTWVACRDAEVVGFVTVRGDEVEELYVERSARGTGVAPRLLRHAAEMVAERGFEGAWLAVAAGNHRARRFYEREGWRDAGDRRYLATCGDDRLPLTVRRYELSLSAATRSRRVAEAVR